MIARDIAVVDVHPDHWVNLIRGSKREKKPGAGRAPGVRRHGWLLLVQHDQIVTHAVLRGEALPDLIGRPVGDLGDLRKRFQAARAVCLERDFLRRALARGESNLSYDMDYFQQVLTYVNTFRAELGTGFILDPPLPNLPLPPFAAIQFAFDRLWPDHSSVVLYVVDEDRGQIFTSLILRKRAGHLDLLSTDLHFSGQGLRAAAWKSDRRRILDLVTARVAPVYLALFSNLSAWRCLREAPSGSGSLRRLRASGDLFIEPFPHRLAVMVTLADLVSRMVRYGIRNKH